MKFVCNQCKKDFKNRPSREQIHRFCSKRCYGNWKIGKKIPRYIANKIGSAIKGQQRVERVKNTCITCNRLFIIRISRLKDISGRFCSQKCYFKWKYPKEKTIKNCNLCSKEFTPFNAEIKKGGGKFCSTRCYHQWHKGENNPAWKGGVTSERGKLYHSKDYYKWRRVVFIRDDFTCQNCGIRSINIEAHHIKPWREYPELIYEISNGITYCKSCHCIIEPRHKKQEVSK